MESKLSDLTELGGVSEVLSNLANEEKKLQERKDLREQAKSRRVKKKRSRNIISQGSATFPSESFIKATKCDKVVLSQYKSKLCLYVVDEIGSALNALENTGGSEDSEVGLSIDEDVFGETKVVDGSEESAEIIRSLFYQVSSRVPEKISAKLGFTREVYFYELLSSHFGGRGLTSFIENSLLVKCRRLFTIDVFPALFSLLFYRYIVKSGPIPSAPTLWPVFLNGVTQILNHDCTQRTRRLFPLFSYLRSKSSEKMNANEVDVELNKIKPVLGSFYYYYCSSSPLEVENFLDEIKLSLDDFLKAALTFITKVPDQKILAHYLNSIAKLKESKLFETLDQTTIHRLHTTLNSLSVAGAPYNPSSSAQKAARNCLDTCFPESRISRRLIGSMFQMWRPEFYRTEMESVFFFATTLVNNFSPFSMFSRRLW